MFLSSRRYFVLPLVLVLVMQLLIPLQSYAAVPSESKSNTPQQTGITLEQAIKIVKENFSIPQEYTEFTSGFSNYNYQQAWSLRWNSLGESGGSFSAQVNASNGEIINIYFSKASLVREGYKLPSLSIAQAKTIAENTVKKLAGEKYSQLKLVENNSTVPINLYGSNSYSFQWQRTENGIPFQGNGVNVQVDADNGSVTYYNLAWNDLTLPKTPGVIEPQKAKEAFTQNKMLALKYFLTPVYRIMPTGSKEQVQLVYELQQNGVIDAFTGKPIVLSSGQWFASEDSATGGMRDASKEKSANQAIPLTPQEQKEIEQNTTLLTKEKAIEIVQKWIDIPASLTLRSMNLNTDGGRRDSKVWYFEWNSPAQENSQSISARVDAVSGEFIAFNYYDSQLPLPQNSSDKSTLTKEAAQKVAEEFLKKIQPEKFNQVKIKADTLADSISKPVPTPTNSISFYYERIVNGIPFPSNGLNITVNPVTKQITSYNTNWWDLDFPKLSESISQPQAEGIFLTSRPLTLKYVLFYNNGIPTEAKLVYQPSNQGEGISDMMEAKTGKFIDWQGKPLSQQPLSRQFTDISGHEAEKEITALGLAGIFGEYNNTFRPAEAITAESLLRSLLCIRNASSENFSLSAQEVLKKAKEQGWLKEDLNPSQFVSRELFSKIMIRYLDLGKIADLTGIYKISYEDANQLMPHSEGYISLAASLGILKLSGNKIEPSLNTTRAQAAYAIIKALEYGLKI